MHNEVARTFSALSAINEAILYAESPEALYQQVCDAAIVGGDYLATGIFLLQADLATLRCAASAGTLAEAMRGIEISTVRPSEGLSIVGEAIALQRPSISNDFIHDARFPDWHERARAANVGAIAALPLVCNGRSVGVLMVFMQQAGAFDDDNVSMLARMAANVSFSLGNFEHEAQRRHTEQAMARMSHMFAALSATNEAIMRAKSRQQLFDMVCEAAVHGAKFGTAAIALAEPASDYLRVVASAGPDAAEVKASKLAVSEALPEGRGLTGTAFRTRQPCVSNDFQADPRTEPFHDMARRAGIRSAAMLPLLEDGRALGVLFFNSPETGTFTPELIELLQRLAENVSFALANFARADEKARDDERKQRLSRMLAALSATNEAIIRAKTRSELFDLVCAAAAEGGGFETAGIALMVPDSDFLQIVAVAGPNAEIARQARLQVRGSDPQQRGVAVTAYLTGKACVSNDYLADPRSKAFIAQAKSDYVKSAAAYPLFSHGQVVGIIGFVSTERDTFTPDFADLLHRLADNVSFALGNFELADEKAKAERQKDRLAQMFEALSATNEAIMRARSRPELFELVCQAAVLGSTFTSTTIVMAEPGQPFMRIAASSGRNTERVKTTRFAISSDLPEGRGMTGTAFRAKAPCIMNDFLSNPNTAHWHALARGGGARSGAAFPLLRGGVESAGVLLFMAGEKGVFTDDLVSLLAKLAENVSFALDNFDRIDEKTRADDRIEYLASHDSLTRLPNREMFNQLLHFTIEAARRFERQFAVLFIDLDRFKVINDSLGHEAGDILLVEIARRLRHQLRGSDVVARLGGDEFVVILESTSDSEAVETVAQTLLTELSQPLLLSGHECHTTASIGIALFPADGTDVQTLTKNADMAMYRAKEDGKNAFRFYTQEVKTQSIERLMLETSLRHALERDEFSLQYQPKVDLTTSQIVGVEALLRWEHPELGMLPPMQFIPLAEETGLIVQIGRWVLNEACAQNMAWLSQGLPPVSMAVNLSPRQFADDNLLHDIDDALKACGMPPTLLQLEVTESMVMQNVARAIKVLDSIRSRGIRLAIDDFGTGYSSMSLMKQFPIDTIKIDRSFVRDLAEDCEDQAIAQAIIAMGKALGMTIVAEGVENLEQETFLRDHACDEMQGYLFSKAVVPEKLAELLRDGAELAPPLQPVAKADPALTPPVELQQTGT